MSHPPSSSVRLMCLLAAVNLTIAGSLKDDEVEVVTLGALQPPLMSQARPSGSGHAEEALLDREESPDQTIARLLRHMFERESQQFLRGEDPEDLNTEMPPAAAAAAAAGAQRTIRQRGGSPVVPEEETESHVQGSVAAAEVGQERHHQRQAAKGGLAIPSTSGVDSRPQGLAGTDSDSENDGGRVEAGTAGVSNDAGVDPVDRGSVRDARGHVEGDGQETSDGASAARGGGDASAGGMLLEDPLVEAEVRHASRQATPGDPAAVAAGSGGDEVLREMSFERSADGGLEAVVSDVGEAKKGDCPGAFAELEEDGSEARELEAAGVGVETVGTKTETDAGLEGGGTGSGDNGGTAAHAVGLDTKVEKRVAVEGETEIGDDKSLSHDTASSTVTPCVDGHTAVVEEVEEVSTIASFATAKDGAAFVAEAEAEAAAEGASIDEVGGVPGIEFVGESVYLEEGAQALMADGVDEEVGGAAVRHVSSREASSLEIDGNESEWAKKEHTRPAVAMPPATVSAESSGNEEGEGGDDAAAGVGEESEVGVGGPQSATNAASSESPAGHVAGIDSRPPPEERRAVPAGGPTDGDGVIESPASNEPGTIRRNTLPETPQAENEGPAVEGEASGEEEPPRARPVFRFSEPLPAGPDVDLGLAEKLAADMIWGGENDGDAFGFPPLPPIDALSGLGAKNDGADEPEGGGSGGGGWGTWGQKLATAVRKKVARWASGAADRGGELANKLVEECKARATKSWHENIEPQAEQARRRLEGVADFCVAKVAEHLSDPVLAEAL